MAKAKATASSSKTLDSYFSKPKAKVASSDVAHDSDEVEMKVKAKPKAKPKPKSKEKSKAKVEQDESFEEEAEEENEDEDEDEDEDEADVEEEDEEDEEDIEMEDEKPKAKGKGKGKAKPQAKDAPQGKGWSDLPPIHDIPSIFADIVGRIPDIKKVAEHIKGRKLRVATMCSGTESPLLALELIRRSIQDQHGIDLEVEHVFSCEIEPFKQAYIERNFQPPLLFRDVCELGQSHATTAYGALAAVPGDVDLLVAGTSCVDYSNLNNEKQDIDGHGESGRTFRGMMSWVTNHRPPIVILENVCSAPWDKVVKYFEKNGYSAISVRVDTKEYYIPHTRQRGYLVAVNKKGSKIPEKWQKRVADMKRRASSMLDAFLLTSDDPRIHQARQKLVQESYNALDRKTGRTDWGRCESRHQRARLEEELGSKRPLTNWEEGGYCKLPDFAWNDWGYGQVERVWDLMDITILREAVKGVDPSYKTYVWNLSQNVDRTIGASKIGICPCLTPSMIPYITNRGGPMVGLEALSMQGLPIDELLLTRETEDQLADLAGNAMSTTVVGTCILAALVEGLQLLRSGEDHQTYEMKDSRRTEIQELDLDAMDIDVPARQNGPENVESHICGDEQLAERPLDLQSAGSNAFTPLLNAAQRSARLCSCEGRQGMTDRALHRCTSCGSSSCVKCGGRPEHDFEPIDLTATPRLSPLSFENQLKPSLPMSLKVTGVDDPFLEGLIESADVTIAPKLRSKWTAAVLRAVKSELRFVELKRQEIWVVLYQSSDALLELSLHPQEPQWRLFARPDITEPASSELRACLQAPVARFTCAGAFLTGSWEFALPCEEAVSVTVEGAGELVDSWEARLGLESDEFKDKQVFSALKISVPESDVEKFGRDISGKYVLLPNCGTACNALHKRIPQDGEQNLPPLFMLLDPSRCGRPEDDGFVISTSTRRYEYGESRPIVCKFDPKWRQSSKTGERLVACSIPSRWAAAKDARLVPSEHVGAIYAVPGDTLTVDPSTDACQSAIALLVCRVPLDPTANPEWPRGEWREVDKVHERATFRALAWLLERIRSMGDQFTDWQKVIDLHEADNCERCAPTAPAILWAKLKNKVVAVEDVVQAGEYERRLKQRPAAFVTQLRMDEDGMGIVRIGANIPSLLHRASSRLPIRRDDPMTLSWRLNMEFTPMAALHLPKFKLMSNRSDPEHKQPQGFKVPLRPEQLRSLTWMLARESPDAEPFIEEEISEAMLGALQWRVEGRAERPVRLRGGVLADEVGYGKTAISLAVIASTMESVKRETAKLPTIQGKIRTHATLVVVPPHLTKQWPGEVKKFTGNKYEVLVLASATNLNKVTIQDMIDADIIVVASNLFHSQAYLDNLEVLSAAGTLPAQPGRYFDSRLETVLASLGGQVDRLRDEGSNAVMTKIRQRRSEDDEGATFVPTKRLKGKTYREAAIASTKSEPAEEVKAVKALAKPKAGTPPKKSVGPSGMRMEVVIPTRIRRSESGRSSDGPPPSSPDELPTEEDSEEEQVRVKPRRAATRKPIIIEDDDDEDVDAGSDFKQDEEAKPPSKPSRGKGAKSSSRRASKGKVLSDEEDDYSAEETASESGNASESPVESDDEPLKKKGKGAKAKAMPAKKAPARKSLKARSSDEDDEMDVDTEASSSKSATSNGKKRKATDSGKKAPKKQKRREDTDPWKLGSKVVQEDWTEMSSPAIEMFHFARVVVDEYTYLKERIHSSVTKLTADRHWVLSGTPPVHDFGSLKTIAAFLDIHLGVDDDGEGKSAEVKKRKREQTGAEKFHSFREVHSLEWHAHRHQLGQKFLNHFVRQNVAEIDEILSTQNVEMVVLPAAERAIYLELEHHLKALEMTIKRGKKTDSDREKRVAQCMGASESAEEALLKRCAHFELEVSRDDDDNGDGDDEGKGKGKGKAKAKGKAKGKDDNKPIKKAAPKTALKACEVIVTERKQQLDNCKAELLKKIGEALAKEKIIGKAINKSKDEDSSFREWIRVSRTNEGAGDVEAAEMMTEILQEAGIAAPLQTITNRTDKGKKYKPDAQYSEKTKAQMYELREQTHYLRRLSKELVGRVRSLRYFTVVRDLQKQRDAPPVVSCPSCGRDEVPMDEVAVLSTCGHTGCFTCFEASAKNDQCPYKATDSCWAGARPMNIVKGDTLGIDDAGLDGRGKHFGAKLEKVMHLLRERIPKDERALIFVQFKDLMAKVADALTANGIPFLEIRGSATAKSKNLEKFQNDGEERVLLLNVIDESASGANLTSANHVIFLSPLLADSPQIYEATETQAIGRVRRYGQTKHVYVWRFLSANTIDEEVFEMKGRRTIK